jgi:hypothetical protein
LKTLLILSVATLAATAAFAEPNTRTVTIDGPKAAGTRTIVRDPAAGTLTGETDVTRKSDGATASRDYSRTRTETRYTAAGTATGFNGQTYTGSGQRVRNGDGSGYAAGQTIVNGDGKTVYDRDVVVARSGGQTTRSVDVTGPSGVQRSRVGIRRR